MRTSTGLLIILFVGLLAAASIPAPMKFVGGRLIEGSANSGRWDALGWESNRWRWDAKEKGFRASGPLWMLQSWTIWQLELLAREALQEFGAEDQKGAHSERYPYSHQALQCSGREGFRRHLNLPEHTLTKGGEMRTSIVLDDELVKRAMELTGLDTKRAVVEEALRVLVRLREQEGIRSLRGKLDWEGDLGELREARFDPSG